MKASSSLGESFAGVADVKQVVFDSIHSLAIRGGRQREVLPNPSGRTKVIRAVVVDHGSDEKRVARRSILKRSLHTLSASR